MSPFRPVEDGIFIGPQPSPNDLEDARQRGIKTVIDFRLPSETAMDLTRFRRHISASSTKLLECQWLPAGFEKKPRLTPI